MSVIEVCTSPHKRMIMSRIKAVDVADWDRDLRLVTNADIATPLERSMMAMLAHRAAIAKASSP